MITSGSGNFVFVLPPFLVRETVAVQDSRNDSEGVTSQVFNCCSAP